MTFRLRPLARALLLSVALSVPAIAIAPGGASAQVDITVSVNIEPPGLPVYDQPPIPEEGYLWTPGYWAWDATDADYFWVPGAWVQPPQVGLLWTPGYWGWSNGVYVFNEGYWGETVGFYGGVDYGYGYAADGYFGGRWEHDHFFYNRTVTNITNVKITNIYEAAVPESRERSRVSFNGGDGGTKARPTPEQAAAAKARHVRPTVEQTRQVKAAQADPQERFKTNAGKPAVAATQKAGDLKGPGAVPAKEAGTPPAKAGEKTPETKPEEGKTPEAKSPETKTPEAKPAEKASPEAKTPEKKAPEPKPSAETKPEEKKLPEAKPEEKAAPAKPEEKTAPVKPEPEPKAEAPRSPEPKAEAPRPAEPARQAEPAPRAEPQKAEPEGAKTNCGKPKCD